MTNCKSLSYADQVAVLSSLVTIADDQEVLEVHLEQKGFSAFRSWQEFIATFCEPSDRAEHRKYQIEEAKLWLGSPDGFPGHLTGHERGYVSSLISEMRDKRDKENGVSYSQISPEEPWKQYIDPCVRRLQREEYLGLPRAEELRRKMEADVATRRAQETQIHGGEMLCSQCETRGDFIEVFESAIGKALQPLGFIKDASRSLEFLPVYSKRIDQRWSLCWSPESERTFCELAKVSIKGATPRIALNLRLYACTTARRRYLVNPIGFRTASVIRIRHDFLIPGFIGVYQYFADVRELHTVVTAHMTLFAQIAEAIESRILRALKRYTS